MEGELVPILEAPNVMVSFAGLLLLGLLGLVCLGVIVAIVLAAMNMRRADRGQEVMRCPECGSKVSPIDRHCPQCGHALAPQEIERLDPDAR